MKKVLYIITGIVLSIAIMYAIVLDNQFAVILGTLALILCAIDFVQFREIRELNDTIDILTDIRHREP